jgi:restriction system protein
MSWFGKRKQLPPETQASLDRLRAMAWPDFERLMEASFQRRGWSVERTGKGGLEGDIDLILRKDGRTELVQCKQWKTRQVSIATVREMWGVVGHRNANAVTIVSAGVFSDDAAQFAQGKAIELIDGERLLDLVRGVTVPSPAERQELAAMPPQVDTAPLCPRCGATTYKRFNLQTSKMYWGCIRYPACKGAQPI